MMSLYKTTVVIWSEVDPSGLNRVMTLQEIVKEADEGDFYCSKCSSEMVDDPSKDPDWDGTEFFGVDEEPDEDPYCEDCQGTGIGNPHIETSRCSYCKGTGLKKRVQEEPE